MIAKIDRKHKGVTEEAWVSGGGIEVHCIYFLGWAKARKSNV